MNIINFNDYKHNPFDDENEELFRMVNGEGIDLDDNIKTSMQPGRIQYGKKKKINNKRVRRAIIIVTLIATMTAAGVLGAAIGKADITDGNVLISNSPENKEYIDQRISYYEKILGASGDIGVRIENTYGRNPQTGDLNVDYNIGNLTKQIIKASDISEVEARCVIIASYNIINAPCRKEVFDKVFSSLSKNEDIINDGSKAYLYNGKDIYDALGYSNENEFKMNAREDTKTINAVEQYLQNGKRR